MLDPRRLLTFREVARQGSFSRAADALALSQPAVSQQVGALERQLGATLLVGSFPSALATVVPAAVAALRARDPRLDVAIEEGTVDDLEAAVARGDLHVAVCWQDATTPRREPDGLKRADLAQESMVAVLPATHRLAGRREVALRDLSGETWMAPEPEGSLVDACRAAGFEPRVAIVSRDPLAARAIVAAGLAVSLTPDLLADLELPGIVTRPLRGVAPPRALS